MQASLQMTRHAVARSQQRAIPQIIADLLYKYGASQPAGCGAMRLYFDKQARRHIRAYAGSLAGQFAEHLDVYMVIGPECQVITVGHQIKRMNRH